MVIMKKILQCCLPGMLWALPVLAQIGVGTTSPNSTFDVRGAMAILPTVFTTSTTATINEHLFLFTGATAATLTLPDATLCTGRIYVVKNASTTSPVPAVTIQPFGAQTIGGLTSAQVSEPYESVRLVSDGANWQVMNENIPVNKTASVGSGWNQGGNSLTSIKNLGTITNFDMAFKTNNVERMRLSTSGYLGIGTTTPAGRLHLVNANDDNGNDYYFADHGATTSNALYLRKARGTIATPQDLQNGDLMAQFRFGARYNNTLTRTDGAGIDAYYLGSGTTNLSDMRFYTSNNERMRISQNGGLAIGATTFSSQPEKLLVDCGTNGSYNVISGKGNIDNYLQLNIRNAHTGGNASSDIVATANNGDESVNFIDMGINSQNYANPTYPILSGNNTAYLYATAADLIIGNGAQGYDLIFFTDGTATTNEKMRITAAGNVGIGTLGNAAVTDKLTVAGIVAPALDNTYSLGASGATWSEVWAASGAIQTSDARLKTAIKPLLYNTHLLAQLKAVQYHWKQYATGNRKIGFIAQEVKNSLPEAVTGNAKKEYLGIDYSSFIPVLINLLQQQQARIATLQQELNKITGHETN
jgi:hypothetical protein